MNSIIIGRTWLFRSESEPSSSAESETILYSTQFYPCDLRTEGIEQLEKDDTLSKPARAAAINMIKDILNISQGDLLVVTYPRVSFVDIVEIVEPYQFENGKHILKAKILTRIERANLPEYVRNRVLRKPRIVAEIENISSLLPGNKVKEVEYRIAVRADYTCSFKLPANFTKQEAYRLAEIFKNCWIEETEES